MTDEFPKMLIVGCGNMGGAMLRGWIAAGAAAERFVVVDTAEVDLPKGVTLHRSFSELNEKFDSILLGIKPQMIGDLAPQIASALNPRALVISILAGTKTATLSKHFPGAMIVRLMPNLAAAIGKSPLALFSDHLRQAGRNRIDVLLAPLGSPVWIEDEAQMDAVTALAGSGPAFVYRFIAALAKGGAGLGLNPQLAVQLALIMVEGATQLAAGSPESPDELARFVTSPGGTTAAGLAVLDKDDAFDTLIAATLRAAAERGAQLSKGK